VVTSNRGPKGIFLRDSNLQVGMNIYIYIYILKKREDCGEERKKNSYQSAERKSGTLAVALKREVLFLLLLDKNRRACE